jgi:hypothetical protein
MTKRKRSALYTSVSANTESAVYRILLNSSFDDYRTECVSLPSGVSRLQGAAPIREGRLPHPCSYTYIHTLPFYSILTGTSTMPQLPAEIWTIISKEAQWDWEQSNDSVGKTPLCVLARVSLVSTL